MMDADTALKTASELLARWQTAFSAPETNRLDVTVEAADLLDATAAFSNGRWGYLGGITGLDEGRDSGTLEILYHYCAGAVVVTLRVRIPRANAALPSICALFPSASVFEREVSEMLGVTFTDSPDTRRLFLPDEWPNDIYPLRKDAALPTKADLSQKA